MHKALITTVPFGQTNTLPLELLDSAGIEFDINPYGRKILPNELRELIEKYDLLIAGTEIIDSSVLERASRLQCISRVGIGLDALDLNYARARGINVAYTPDAPAPAVAELTIGLMLSLARGIHISNSQIHEGQWERIFGKRIPEMTIGVIGAGRIGGRVLRRLSSFGSPRVLVNDIRPDYDVCNNLKIEWVDKQIIYKECDVISFHLPLTIATEGLVTSKEIDLMKKDVLLINTARGGIIDEDDLAVALKMGRVGGAAIDVFVQEPYSGPLADIRNCILTAHMGSMSIDCRQAMEIQAVEEVVRFVKGEPLSNPVPAFEYEIQNRRLSASTI